MAFPDAVSIALECVPVATHETAEVRAFLEAADLTTAGLDAADVRLWCVRDADRRIVGTTGIELSADGRAALIRSVAVDPRLRACGVGTALALHALARAREHGAESAWLFSRRSGPFWRSLGFAEAMCDELARALPDAHQVRLFAESGRLASEVAWSRPLATRWSGLVLAAGRGTRFGGPKGLAREPDGEPWVARAVSRLREAGASRVVVAVGAAAHEVAALVPPEGESVEVADFAEGVGATLRVGIRAARGGRARSLPHPAHADGAASAGLSSDAVVIVPVDTPGLPAAAIRRVVDAAGSSPEQALVRACYDGAPGHPVLIGRTHVEHVAASASGDRGAGAYLAAHGALAVECGDLWSGDDIDSRPSDGERGASS